MAKRYALGLALVAAALFILALCCGRDNTVSPNLAPTATFTVTPAAGTIGTLFVVDASGSSDIEDSSSCLQVRWDWESDGIWDTDWSPAKEASHRYAETGNKTIRLSVKDRAGATHDADRAVEVAEPSTESGRVDDPSSHPKLVATFNVSPATGTTGTLFGFDASACSDAMEPASELLVRWDWEADGTWDTDWSSVKTASHYFDEVGVRTVTLAVRNRAGVQDDTSCGLTVSGLNVPPQASFTISPASGPPWISFRFDASASSDAEDAGDVLSARWDWDGDGTWDTDWSTSKTASYKYPISGDRTPKLMVRDGRGATAEASQVLQVTNGDAPPFATFTVTPLWGPADAAFNFDASGCHNHQGLGSSEDALVQVRWDWENDGIWDTEWSTTKTVSHEYATEGPRTIRLIVKSTLGCIDDTTRAILVTNTNAAPVARFNACPPSGPTDACHFDASPSSDIEDDQSSLEVRWDWKDDGTWDTNWSHVKTATHSYSTNGKMTIRLQVRDTAGLMDDTTGTVVLPGYPTPPIASFEVSPDTGGIETVFQFDASSSMDWQDPESLLTVVWDWESDGSWDCRWTPIKTASHRYESLGQKQVTLQVRDTYGLIGAATRSVWVLPANNLPTAVFTATPTTGHSRTRFYFDASGCSDPDEPSSALRVRWDFQDDGVWDRNWTTSKKTDFVYGGDLGTKTVRLEVTDSRGGTDDATVTFEVTEHNAPPVASFTISPASGGSQDTLFHFDASASADSDDAIANIQCRWDWEGDGIWDVNWTLDKRSSHKFGEPGTKNVILQVRDSWEAIGETSRTLVVAANPVASFTIDPTFGPVETVFQCDASASSDAEDPVSALVVRWDWENDGVWDTDWSTEKTLSHQYLWTGMKTIRLDVKDTNGGIGSAVGTVSVTSHDYPDGEPTSREELVEGINGLGFDVLKRLVAENPNSNVVTSPLSISLALGMTVNGSRGATRDEMLSVLGLTGHSVPGADEIYGEHMRFLTTLDPNLTFEIANSAWCQSGGIFKQPFLDACRAYFSAEIRDVDFANDPIGAPDSVNAWINDKTHGRIPAVVPVPGNPATRLMLVDAMYFLGRWREEFDPAYTRDGWFTLSDGSRQACRMMKSPGRDPDPEHDYLGNFEYYSEYSAGYDGFQMIDLAYGDSIFSMSIILPYGGRTVDQLISELSTTQWNQWVSDLDHCHGTLLLPKFELRFLEDIRPTLIALGMVTPFSPINADFSGIADFALWISHVWHATYIKVDEAGTEAAAVTVVEQTTGIPPDCEEFYMNINHPFLFVIRENRANTILFIGKVAHPN